MNRLQKQRILISTMVLTSLSLPVLAVEGLSANISATNNYLWRGVTQTQNNAAIAGGLDYVHQSGVSIGAWTSNASLTDQITYEADFYASYAKQINTEFSYSVGYIYYSYDSTADADLSEVYASLAYQNLTLTYNTLVDSEAGGDFGDDSYISIDANFTLVNEIGLALHVGNYQFDTADNYSDYSITLSKNEFSLSLSDTTIAGSEGDLNIQLMYSKNFAL
jgi:uncharacterized protein (TIGR02001 family)